MPKPTKPAPNDSAGITIEPLVMQELSFCVLGASPLILHDMGAKALRELLLPARDKNRATRRSTLKHDVMAEFTASAGPLDQDPDSPTLLSVPAAMFKAAAMTAALEVPGVARTSVGRLLWVTGQRLRIWGVPQLLMSVTRSAGIQRTPDVRTRAIVPEWATQVTVRYPPSHIDPSSVANLFAAAGQICGIGDFRQEKGKGSYGVFALVNQGDAAFKRIIAEGGRAAQAKAMAAPEPHDAMTSELWSWYEDEITNRRRGAIAAV